MSEETTFYSDGAIRVTNARAVIGGKTYAMANITSVSMGTRPANRNPGIVIAIVGLLIAACTGIMASDGAGGIVFGILVLVAGIVVAVIAKPSYIVRIGSASGEADALVSKDREYIQKIVNATNEAIIKRG
jgi:hypothetical protein